jgi:hypothetical protein
MLVADWLCRIALGAGRSHGDVAGVLGADAIGLVVGALFVPCCVWYLTRRIDT